MTSLKLSMDMHGIKSVELVPSYLILGEASQGLGNMIQAQEYLSQAEWTVLKNPDCPLPTVSKLHRNIAMLQMAQGDFESALRNLANDVSLPAHSLIISYHSQTDLSSSTGLLFVRRVRYRERQSIRRILSDGQHLFQTGEI